MEADKSQDVPLERRVDDVVQSECCRTETQKEMFQFSSKCRREPVSWLWAVMQGEFHLQFSSVAMSCPTLCNPMHCSTPGFPVQLLELAQTRVHRVGDAIQPSHPLSSPSPPTFNLSQHQNLFQWVSSSHEVAKGLVFPIQHQSFQWVFRTDFLQDGLAGSPCCPRDSQESSPTPQFKSINSSVRRFLYSPTLTSVHDYWENHSFD